MSKGEACAGLGLDGHQILHFIGDVKVSGWYSAEQDPDGTIILTPLAGARVRLTDPLESGAEGLTR